MLERTYKGVTLQVTAHQERYCGTYYEVSGVPQEWEREDILKACGYTDGWWVSGWRRDSDYAEFNVNYD